MRNDIKYERVSYCVDSKHGNGVVSRPVSWLPLTLKYEYDDGYCEYLTTYKLRRKIAKYGFLKHFRGKFEPLPDGPIQTVQTDKYDRTVDKHSIKYTKKETFIIWDDLKKENVKVIANKK